MKKNLIIFGIASIVIVTGLCGCISDNGDEKNSEEITPTGKIVIMNASQLHEDREDRSGGFYTTNGHCWDNLTRNYKSVDEGDTLVIIDYICEIIYQAQEDKTLIVTNDPIIGFHFKGNLEKSYNIGDKIRVTVQIKHVELSYTISDYTYNYDVEIFKEQWENRDYFIQHKLASPLPTSCIKIENA